MSSLRRLLKKLDLEDDDNDFEEWFQSDDDDNDDDDDDDDEDDDEDEDEDDDDDDDEDEKEKQFGRLCDLMMKTNFLIDETDENHKQALLRQIEICSKYQRQESHDENSDEDQNSDYEKFIKDIENDLELAETLKESNKKQLSLINKTLATRRENVDSLKKIAKDAQNLKEGCTVVKTASNVTAIAGGACLLAAPFTGGLSLLGGIISGVSAATTIGTSLTEFAVTKNQINKAEEIYKQDKQQTEALERSINSLETVYVQL